MFASFEKSEGQGKSDECTAVNTSSTSPVADAHTVVIVLYFQVWAQRRTSCTDYVVASSLLLFVDKTCYCDLLRSEHALPRGLVFFAALCEN